MIVLDVSTLVGAAIRRDSTPEQALRRALAAELALAAGAHTIVSSDADLLVLDPWRGIRILRPAEFLTLP